MRARGYPPIEGDHALIVEVAPGLAIERVIDLALKSVPEVEPGIHFVERQFGVLEVHSRDPALVERAGEAILAGIGAEAEDALRPRLLYVDVIEDVTDQHAVIVNRNREASMLLPGQTLLVVEMTPALFAAVAANAAERVAPGPDARHRLDDRRRRPRLPRGHDRGYRARARRDHARAERDGPRAAVGEDEKDGMTPRSSRADRRARRRGARPLRPVAGGDGHALQRLREPHLPRRRPRVRARYALRVHRAGYRTARADRVRAAVGRRAARGRRGRHLRGRARARTASASSRFRRRFGAHNVVLFEWLPGAAPDPEGDAVIAGFRTLGAVSARMHAHARAWSRPPDSTARRGTTSTRSAPAGTGAPGRTASAWAARSARCSTGSTPTIAARLEAYGQASDRFGLVHADIRLANLLVDGGQVRVIDFDDCGFAWFMYDFATTVSFMEDHPRVPELRDAWLEGYRSVAPLDAADEAELDTFVMLRRLLLVAWIGSHHTFATEAAELGAGFTAGTCALAERYLSTHSCRRARAVFTPLTGRTVLVTGGTKGIGKGIAGVFAQRRRERRRRRRATASEARRRRRELGARSSPPTSPGGGLRAHGRARRSSDSAASTSCAPTPACSPTSSSRT